MATTPSESSSEKTTTVSVRSGRGFLGKSLSWRDKSSTVKDEPEAPKGPLGLTTLYEPPDGLVVAADLIFVHGLNGGSRSTWSKGGGDNAVFWPRDWLPRDDAFRDVRVHTFGYSSGLSSESVLDIHDFAGGLLARICNSPTVASDTQSPILLVGHSMGGLVVKKAYILAHQDPEYSSLADRIKAALFLATPHQGAGISQLLSRFLILAGPRPFVNDLHLGSRMLQRINEEFPRYVEALQLFSFYESQPMFYGVGKGLIVEKHCAVMYYANERRTYLDANHRDVARFSTQKDPNYISVRNALATIVDSLRAATPLVLEKTRPGKDKLVALGKFLGVYDAPEDALVTNESRKLPGSCEWLIQKDSFQQWRNALTSKVFWLRAGPGAGKTVLASHVISHLRASNLDCCYFFFTHGNEEKGTINALLRSMAWQMVALHPDAFATISDATDSFQDRPLDKIGHGSVWRRVFTDGLLKVKLQRPQYWVLDALDECKDSRELIFFLRKAQEIWPLCILVTSRAGVETHLSTVGPSLEVISYDIGEDSKPDIASFLSVNLHRLPGATTDAQQEVSDRILKNSRGSFLWVSLVLEELPHVHTTTDINRVLDSNHSGMDAIYARIFDEMSRAKYGKHLVRAILTWATCAFRSLSIDELRPAVEMVIQDSVDDIRKCIGACGNLILIDKANKVQFAHLSAKEFLTQEGASSEFIIDQSAAHKKLAQVCIQTLCGKQGIQKKSSRTRRMASDATKERGSVLYNYAATYVFQHVLQIKSMDDDEDILAGLAQFLGARQVLFWIEHLAKHNDLQRLYHAGMACTSLVARRTQQGLDNNIQKKLLLVERWGTDLVGLVNKFGRQLSYLPVSIHTLIPPFCPSESALHKQFVHRTRGLSLHGRLSKDWDSHLCTISYPRPVTLMNVASSRKRIATALSNGTVMVHDIVTLLETNRLEHQECVRSISFSDNGKLLASGGEKNVRVWDLGSSEEVTSFCIPSLCMSITFIDDDEVLLIATMHNSVVFWDILQNAPHGESVDWTRDIHDTNTHLYERCPMLVVFSAEQNLLAAVYRGFELLLWTLDGEQIYDMYEKGKGSTHSSLIRATNHQVEARAVAFASTLENNFLVAAYLDGDVVVYDTDSGDCRGIIENVNAQTVACSPDGRILATADSQGNIKLFDLQTLKLVYRLIVDTSAIRISKIAFTPDNLRLLNIGGRQLSVWDPTVLLRQESADELGGTLPCLASPKQSGSITSEGIPITAMVCIRDASGVIYGREDGSVYIHTGSPQPHSQELFTQTKNCSVTVIHFDDASYTLTCGDSSGRVTSRRLIVNLQNVWAAGEITFDKRSQSSVSQAIASVKHDRLLVCTHENDTLWVLKETGATDCIAEINANPRRKFHTSFWLTSLTNEELLVKFGDSSVTFYLWESLVEVRCVKLALDKSKLYSILPLRHPQYFASRHYNGSDEWEPRDYYLWKLEDFAPESGEVQENIYPVLNFGRLDIRAEAIIGVVNNYVLFLDSDNWVCSATIPLVDGKENVSRHFFIPDDWKRLANGGFKGLVQVQQSGNIVIAKQADIIVVHCGIAIPNNETCRIRHATSARVLPQQLE